LSKLGQISRGNFTKRTDAFSLQSVSQIDRKIRLDQRLPQGRIRATDVLKDAPFVVVELMVQGLLNSRPGIHLKSGNRCVLREKRFLLWFYFAALIEKCDAKFHDLLELEQTLCVSV
jgi:hypothetical protein